MISGPVLCVFNKAHQLVAAATSFAGPARSRVGVRLASTLANDRAHTLYSAILALII